jgi:SulP family sulfate permease
MKIIRIDGSLFFGAIDHIQQRIRALTPEGSGTNRLLIIGKGINFIDIAGAEMLIQEARRLQQRGGKLMFSSLKGTLLDELRANGYLAKIGEELFFDSPEAALAESVVALDQETCHRCTAHIFRECPAPAKDRIIAVSKS